MISHDTSSAPARFEPVVAKPRRGPMEPDPSPEPSPTKRVDVDDRPATVDDGSPLSILIARDDDLDDVDDDDDEPRTPGGGPLTLKRARELRAAKETGAEADDPDEPATAPPSAPATPATPGPMARELQALRASLLSTLPQPRAAAPEEVSASPPKPSDGRSGTGYDTPTGSFPPPNSMPILPKIQDSGGGEEDEDDEEEDEDAVDARARQPRAAAAGSNHSRSESKDSLDSVLDAVLDANVYKDELAGLATSSPSTSSMSREGSRDDLRKQGGSGGGGALKNRTHTPGRGLAALRERKQPRVEQGGAGGAGEPFSRRVSWSEHISGLPSIAPPVLGDSRPVSSSLHSRPVSAAGSASRGLSSIASAGYVPLASSPGLSGLGARPGSAAAGLTGLGMSSASLRDAIAPSRARASSASERVSTLGQGLGATTPREAMDEMGSSSGSGSGSADENVPLGGHARGGKRYDASASRSIAAEEEEDAEEETLAGLRKSMKAAQTRAVANASANGATPTTAQGRGLAALRERKGFQRMDARAVIEATPEPDARADVVPIAPAPSPSDDDDDDEIDLPGLDDPPAPVATKAARGDDGEAMKEATDADAGRPHPGSRAAFESKIPLRPSSASGKARKDAAAGKTPTSANPNPSSSSSFGSVPRPVSAKGAPGAGAIGSSRPNFSQSAKLAPTVSAGYKPPPKPTRVAGAVKAKSKPAGAAAKIKPPATAPAAAAAAAAAAASEEPPKPKKETFRNRLNAARSVVAAEEDELPAAAAADDAADEPTAEPIQTVTPMKLKETSPDRVAATADAARPKPDNKWATRSIEARNRLRRHRRSTSVSVDAPPTAEAIAAAEEEARRAAEEEEARRAAAASSAAAMVARLGSVTNVKPRSSSSSSVSKSKTNLAPQDAEAARRAAEHAAAFARAEAEEAAKKAAAAAAAATTASGHPVVHGLDEAELVLRMGSLASAEQLASARAAVARMSDLLEKVEQTSKRLRVEPQNVFGHLLMRGGVPTDPVSAAVQMDKAVSFETLQRMTAACVELRSLLRIKVQDNNDLALADKALRETTAFFARLDKAAAEADVAPHALLLAQRPESARERWRGRR